MFKSPEKMLNNLAIKSAMKKNEPLSEEEISLENLRHNIKNLNINSTIKATQYSIESNIPLSVILSAGKPHYSTEGFFGELGKSIKSSLSKFVDLFKNKNSPELNATVFNVLKPEVKEIIYSDKPEETYKKIISSKIDNMIERVSTKLKTYKEIDLEKRPINEKFISELLKKVVKSANKIINEPNICFTINLTANSDDEKALRAGADANADESTVNKSFAIITKGINFDIDQNGDVIYREIIDKYSDKDKARKILLDTYTNSNVLKSVYERTKDLANQKPPASTEASDLKDTNKTTAKKRAILNKVEKDNRNSWYIFWLIMAGPVGFLISYFYFQSKDKKLKKI